MKRIIGLATVNRRLIVVVVACVALSACVHLPDSPSTSKPSNDGSKSSSATKTGNGSSYAANAANVNDACPLMPADLVKKIVPNANAPTREQYPRRCNISNGTSVLEITIETGIATPVDPVNGAEFELHQELCPQIEARTVTIAFSQPVTLRSRSQLH